METLNDELLNIARDQDEYMHRFPTMWPACPRTSRQPTTCTANEDKQWEATEARKKQQQEDATVVIP